MSIQIDNRPLQDRVEDWIIDCFGRTVAHDRTERNHRFLEESLELVQACGTTAGDAHAIVDYVYGRPVGEKEQECGGVLLTLAALCSAHGIDMNRCGEGELARVWVKFYQIRSKQAAKPKIGPLPEDVR